MLAARDQAVLDFRMPFISGVVANDLGSWDGHHACEFVCVIPAGALSPSLAPCQYMPGRHV